MKESTLSISLLAKPLLLWVVLSSLSILSPFTSAFVSPLFRSNKCSSKDSAALYLAKIKRGRLSPNFLEQEDFDTNNKKPTGPRIKERSKRLSKKKKNATSAAKQQTKKNTSAEAVVSPALAQWAASSSSDDSSSNSNEVTMDSTTNEPLEVNDAATFQSFDQDSSSTNKKASSRRVRQSERQAAEQAREAEIEAQVALVKECLGIVDDDEDDKENKSKSTPQTNIADLLHILQQLTHNQKSSAASDVLASLKQLSSSKTSTDYRLAWVGSDEAICHIGTGLHKVPLARLQEVFLTLPGRNQVVLQEVIRILGPFPNIRNTLQGTCRPSSNNSGETVDWNWTWESMVDGTGKEILAGKEENTQSVPLTVHFAHSSMVVASVPGDDKDGDKDNRPWKENGENVLLFLREADILTSLEKLRVA